jgi:hypothetical protein
MAEVCLPCSTPECNSTPQHINITVSEARARFEYRLRYDPKYIFRLECDKCGRPTHFTYEQILSLLPQNKRPKPMPHDHFWAYLLFELKVWKDGPRAFLGGRVLVQRLLVEPGGDWYGTSSRDLPMPRPRRSARVAGRPRGNTRSASVIEQEPETRSSAIQDPRTRSFGMFVSPKTMMGN